MTKQDSPSPLPWKPGDIVGEPTNWDYARYHGIPWHKYIVVRTTKTRVEVEYFNDRATKVLLTPSSTKALRPWTKEMQEQQDLVALRKTLSGLVNAVRHSNLKTITDIGKIRAAIDALKDLDCVE